MSGEENVRIRFIVPKDLKSESLCSEDMKMAFQVGMLSILRIIQNDSSGISAFYITNYTVEEHPMR
jgi:hypothetical protein